VKNNLYSSTALKSPEICRDPITAMIAGALSVKAGTLAYSLISMGVSLAVSAVASWASMALAPKPQQRERGLLTNLREATAPRQYVYGTVRKGGVITYVESTGGEKNAILHQIIVLAGHEVYDIPNVYLNDEIVAISGHDFFLSVNGSQYQGGGWVISEKWMKPGDVNEPRIRILMHRGNQTAATDLFANHNVLNLENSIIAESAVLDTNFVGKGCAYLYVRMDYDDDVFANGIPLVTAEVEGKKVYRHGDQAVDFSANFADVVRDYITGDHGLGDDVATIDETDFSVAASVSDEDVALAAGGTQKRYEINGVISADQAPSEVLGNMMTAGAASLFWGQGQWKLRPGYYTAPVKTLTLADLRSGMSVDPRVPMRDNFNVVRGTFIDAAQDYIQADFPQIASAPFLAADNGVENALDLPLPFTTNAAAAQRLAKMTLFRGREQAAFSAEFSMAAFDLEPGDIIALTIEKYGWNEKEFEVTDWRLTPGADGTAMGVGLRLRETSAAAYDWLGDESAILGNNTFLPDPRLNLAVANIQAVPFTRQNGDGTTLVGARITWDAAQNAFVSGYEIQWRIATDPAYQSAPSPDTSFDIMGLVSGQDYVVRVRALSSDGRKGMWASATFTGGGDDTIPNPPTNLRGVGGFQSIAIDWDAPLLNTDASLLTDLAYYNLYRNTSADVNTAVYVGAAAGLRYLDGGLGDDATYSYWVTAVDKSGNESAKSVRLAVTTNFISAAQMVSDIRAQMGAARIDLVDALPQSADPGFDYVDGDFVTFNSKLYERKAGAWVSLEASVGAGAITATEIANGAISTPKLATNAITSDKLAANSVTAGAISAGAVSADKMAVTSLAAITADLGSVTAGSINTVSGGVGIMINHPSYPKATYVWQNSGAYYGLRVENVSYSGGALFVKSNGGFAAQVEQSASGTGWCALTAQNTTGGYGQVGLSSSNGGVGFNAVRGGYYDSSGVGYLPFTGCHEALMEKGHAAQPGDIVIDGEVIAKKLSDAITVVHLSAAPAQAAALGVFTQSAPFEYTPAALLDNSDTYQMWALWDQYDLARVNSVGEGCVNVTGEGGDIAAGDLIVTSSTPGKGMRQADDLVRSVTVAKAREAVTFATPGEQKQIACIYLCG
jgi:hypothetical protein